MSDNCYPHPFYDGTGSWEHFISNFECFAKFNQWSDYEWAVHLEMSMLDKACLFLGTLNPLILRDYVTLKKVLSDRYAQPVNVNDVLHTFRNLFRKSGDNAFQYARELETLLERVLPNEIGSVSYQYMLVHQFIPGLGNPDCAEFVQLHTDFESNNFWHTLVENAVHFEAVMGCVFTDKSHVNTE